MSASADRNLLFGILALQMDFIARDQLIAAMNAWVLDKAMPLGRILLDHAALDDDTHALLDALVQKHLAVHGNDPAASLAALSPLGPGGKDLRRIADPDVQSSVDVVGRDRPADDQDETASLRVGTGTSSGARFRVLRRHAKGSLGQVSVAIDEELHREVALKEIQEQHADHSDSRTRFVLEAEVTGGLEHPGVVPVYGLGTYDDGRPFYAMRFIRGDSLRDAIRHFHAAPSAGRFDALAFRQLLGRFVDVCQAVAYAHSRGVLHRDLKPGNVMLGKYGETLVVDWGLAKPLGRPGDASGTEGPLRPAAGGPAATVLGSVVGTPAYMSPEQADGRVDELGPATDVYGLGAILYDLLTDQGPFAGETIEDVLAKVRRGDFPPPRQVRPAVPRPLDAICRKAMALKPADRYAGALDLAADVEHWLADEPVAAYREPAGARVRRWVRKHARLTTAIAAALAVGALALGLLALERERARGAVAAKEAETARERDAKEAEREKAAAERDRAVAARKRTREALDAMVSGVTGESLATQSAVSPEQKAFLESVLTYYEEFAAEPGQDREGRERLAGAHRRLGLIYDRLGRPAEGAAVVRRAVALYARLAAEFPAEPAYRRDQARSHNNLGILLDDLGKPAQAETEYRSAVALQEGLAGEFPAVTDYRQQLARTRTNLGIVLNHQRKATAAEAEYRVAAAVAEKLAAEFPAVAENRREVARARMNLGVLLHDLGRGAEAEAEYRAARAALEQMADAFPTVPVHRQQLARIRMSLGIVLASLDKAAEAEAEYRAGRAAFQRLAADFPAVPEYRRDLARSHTSLGNVLAGRDKEAEAEVEYRAAQAALERLTGDFPAVPDYRRDLAATHTSLGNLLHGLDKGAEAEVEYRAAIALRERLAAEFPTLPEYHHQLAGTRMNLGIVLAGLRKHAAAETEYLAALAVRERLATEFPDMRDYTVELCRTYASLGDFVRAGGDPAAAVGWHTKAVDRLAPVVAADPRAAPARRLLRASHWGRATDLTLMDRHADALPDWDRALALDDGAARRPLRLRRAKCLARLGRAADAVREADALAADPKATAGTVYDCAGVHGLAAAAPANPDADRHAARAVELLRQAIAKGYRNIPRLVDDADLAPIRGRADYAVLFWDLADTPALAEK